MKILMTGHKGFIGKNMKPYLESKGHKVTGFEWNDRVGGFPDVTDQDLVIHLGAISSTTETDVNKIMDHNYDFSYKLLLACCENKVDLQYASSASVYGTAHSKHPFKEDDAKLPNNPYAWSKYLFDRLVLKSIDKLPIKVQGFRYFNVMGPHDEHKGDSASLITKWKEFNYVKVFEGSKNIFRDFIHVDDVCKIHELFFDIEKSDIVNVGTGTPRSFMELAEHMDKEEIIEIPMPDSLKNQYQDFTMSDNTKLESYIGQYEFRYPF
tara:strand:+ start:2046 stop:2843 length:798 start_codon:yes stop_codon:yes gene_type:complete